MCLEGPANYISLEKEAAAIDKYLKSLKSIPSPYLINGGLSQRAKCGRNLFETAGCSSCHNPEIYAGLKE